MQGKTSLLQLAERPLSRWRGTVLTAMLTNAAEACSLGVQPLAWRALVTADSYGTWLAKLSHTMKLHRALLPVRMCCQGHGQRQQNSCSSCARTTVPM